MSRTASPPAFITVPSVQPDDEPFDGQPTDKISAYYSLVFPKFTYYLQTLSVTIGRRCIPSSAQGSSDSPQVDVDLGPLKSVSRLHARIEYDDDEERFVLAVLGRNGAWVDGAWSGKGSKVPLGERSQIQIASRTFHFVLPPPPAPDDSPSPSSRASSRRARSPSVDVTGVDITPPSSIPSISPPPPRAAASPPPPAEPGAGREKGKGHAGKKRKLPPAPNPPAAPPPAPAPADPPKPVPRPEDMPPKPNFTYAQLCYRAIKAMNGKGTLQEIVHWMMRNYDWYRYNQGSGWEKSVRHNLSSNRAFKKVERQAGDRGKGYYWTIEPSFEPVFEEQEQRAAAAGKAKARPAQPAPAKAGKTPSASSAPTATAKTEHAPAPPPAPTSAPAASPPAPSAPAPSASSSSSSIAPLASSNALALSAATPAVSAPGLSPTPAVAGPSPSPAPPTGFPPIPASVVLPIIVGPLPPAAAAAHPPPGPHLPAPPIVLHENTLILCPAVFGHLRAEEVRALEARGAQRALEELQGHIVRFLKEKIRSERGKKRRKRERASGEGALGAMGGPAPKAEIPVQVPVQAEEVPGSPIVIVDDDDDDNEPAAKRRRVEVGA
ncbi:hypothetical protein K488DRAFT_82452 [Vararia minispora EC-137]|uniref:Uncharacterized protein n=1 Tax=Vararia minispora EC-137 TaxID=1314806 RepID=A0ACB8QW30_9AGAM|nr:hypothetical protein K488DRAFT_82452 [Vararia minispora EC-137]